METQVENKEVETNVEVAVEAESDIKEETNTEMKQESDEEVLAKYPQLLEMNEEARKDFLKSMTDTEEIAAIMDADYNIGREKLELFAKELEELSTKHNVHFAGVFAIEGLVGLRQADHCKMNFKSPSSMFRLSLRLTRAAERLSNQLL